MAMNGRSIASFLFSLILVAVLIGIGAGIYQAGVSQGIIDAGRFPAGTTVPVANDGWGFHGFLGLLFPLLFLLLIFGLVRAAFSRGRGWRHGGGYGYGWGHGYGPGSEGPDSWREERERRMSELHRRLHEAEGGPGSTGRDAGAAGGSATT
jgi:hypothetical protein